MHRGHLRDSLDDSIFVALPYSSKVKITLRDSHVKPLKSTHFVKKWQESRIPGFCEIQIYSRIA